MRRQSPGNDAHTDHAEKEKRTTPQHPAFNPLQVAFRDPQKRCGREHGLFEIDNRDRRPTHRRRCRIPASHARGCKGASVRSSQHDIRWPKRDRHVFLEGSIPFSHQISTTRADGVFRTSAAPSTQKSFSLALAKQRYAVHSTALLGRVRKVLCRASADSN